MFRQLWLGLLLVLLAFGPLVFQATASRNSCCCVAAGASECHCKEESGASSDCGCSLEDSLEVPLAILAKAVKATDDNGWAATLVLKQVVPFALTFPRTDSPPADLAEVRWVLPVSRSLLELVLSLPPPERSFFALSLC